MRLEFGNLQCSHSKQQANQRNDVSHHAPVRGLKKKWFILKETRDVP
jgi:hypothetical protein